MFSYYLTKIGIPRVSISVVDLEIAIKGIVTCAFPENRRRSSLGRPKENRRRSSLGWVMFVYFLLSRRLLLSRSTRAFPKDRRRSPLDVVACLYRLDSACFCR